MIKIDYHKTHVGGVYYSCSSNFNQGNLPHMARTLKANKLDSGILIEYD